LWQSLKLLGYGEEQKTNSKSLGFEVNGEITFDKEVVADNLNTFFTTVASNLVEKLPGCSRDYGEGQVLGYYSNMDVQFDAFSFTAESQADLSRDCLNPAPKLKASKILLPSERWLLNLLPPCVTHLINIYTDMKHATVIPIHKKGRKKDKGNYRPVSVLSVLSKVLGKK
jgi:hypothetical protein